MREAWQPGVAWQVKSLGGPRHIGSVRTGQGDSYQLTDSFWNHTDDPGLTLRAAEEPWLLRRGSAMTRVLTTALALRSGPGQCPGRRGSA